MPSLENQGLCVELEETCNVDMQQKMLERMRNLKAYLESLQVDNLKLMNAKSDQEEINELILNV